MRKQLYCCVFYLTVIRCANKAKYLLVKTARCVSTVTAKVFVPVVNVSGPSANHPKVFDGNKKKPRTQ